MEKTFYIFYTNLRLALRKKAMPAIKQPKNVPAAETCMYTRIFVEHQSSYSTYFKLTLIDKGLQIDLPLQEVFFQTYPSKWLPIR